MPEAKQLRTQGLVLAGILALSVALFYSLATIEPVRADDFPQETEAYCLTCHGDPDLKLTLPSGESLSLFISSDSLHAAVHSQAGIECEACHTDIKTYPHPAIDFTNKRDLARAYYAACQKCHPANYEKTLDSIHQSVAVGGNLDAPICTDCHGAHYVKSPVEPRSLISTTCGVCHDQVLAEYKDSIHGSALITEDNPDVPVCTDCHGVHNIQDPRTAQFRIQEPDLCASCHTNQELMDKYSIRSDVYDLYRLSWHGVDLSVYRARWPTLWHQSAVCSDCHGIHNIRSTDDPASMVHPSNLLRTCQECHPGASPNWTRAWVGHNRIDPFRTPFLFYTQQFYVSFIPVVLWLSILYVILQIIHTIVVRVRRSLS
jgi:predicted CXXCH cytochrome family protein